MGTSPGTGMGTGPGTDMGTDPGTGKGSRAGEVVETDNGDSSEGSDGDGDRADTARRCRRGERDLALSPPPRPAVVLPCVHALQPFLFVSPVV
jgi:hypothetical protein